MLGREKNIIIQKLKDCRNVLNDKSDRDLIDEMINKYISIEPEVINSIDFNKRDHQSIRVLITRIVNEHFFDNRHPALEWTERFYRNHCEYDDFDYDRFHKGIYDSKEYDEFHTFYCNIKYDVYTNEVPDGMKMEYIKLLRSESYYGLRDQAKLSLRMMILNFFQNDPGFQMKIKRLKELETKFLNKVDYEFSKQKQSEHAENFRALMRSNGQIEQQGNFGGGSQSPSQLEQAS